ncbi:MAG: redoxin domain-containing protein, partial [Flavobacteriales bacterium]|nr:redoxin domain-containing protein [Flavobacteriales bacterium]
MGVLVGKKAPGFSAKAVINGGEIVSDFTLEQFKGKYVVLFFYPKDFTF